MNNVLICIAIMFVGLLAFSKGVRRKMFVRDKMQCVGCGRRWDDGWMLHAAHDDHTKDCKYDKLENGHMRCIPCHLAQHEQMFENATSKRERDFHAGAIRKLKKLSWYNYKRNPAN